MNYKGKNKVDIKYRLVRKEDGFEWYTLLSKVCRASYSHILPEEYFDARDRSVESRAGGFTAEAFSGDRKIAYVAEEGGKIGLTTDVKILYTSDVHCAVEQGWGHGGI